MRYPPRPSRSEQGFEILLDEARKLFGVNDIEVSERWQGVYCSAPGSEFLIENPLPGTRVVTVNTGIGMTTSMGLAERSVERALAVAAHS